MKIVISKFPSILKHHPDHVLQKLSCDIDNYLIGKGVCDEDVPDLVEIRIDEDNERYCDLILEIKNNAFAPIKLVHMVDYLRVFRQNTNLLMQMRVCPLDTETLGYVIEL